MSIRISGRKVSREVRAFVGWLETVIDIRHDVELEFCRIYYGQFDAPKTSPAFPQILVSTQGDVLDTIAHEFVHYEQWRDKRELTERGVKQRAAAIVRRWRNRARKAA